MTHIRRSAWLLVLVVLAASATTAHAARDKVTVHGMISQGYLKSSANNYMIPTEDGSLAYTELALNFSSNVSRKLRVGAQLFGRDFGDEGNGDVAIDWAFGDYRWKDYLGFRGGKIKLALGLYNQTRDIDMVRTSILLPQSVYTERFRDVGAAMQGFSLYGSLPLGGISSFEYETFYGTLNLEDTPVIGLSLSLGSMGSVPLTYETVDRWAFGLNFKLNTPVEGLRFGWTYAETEAEGSALMSGNPDPLGMTGGMAPALDQYMMDFELDLQAVRIYSAEYVVGDLTLAGEFMRWDHLYTFHHPIYSALESPANREGYYGSASYRFSELLEGGVFYSEYFPNKRDKEGELLPLNPINPQPEHRGWQKDLAFSARFDLQPWWVLKLEYHSIKGTGDPYTTPGEDGLEEDWSLFGMKSTFHF